MKTVIVEGMDRCGKDSCIKEIMKYMYNQEPYTSVQVLHYSNLPIKNKKTLIEASKILYTDMFKLINFSIGKFNLILNRAHLGEWVYGSIYRNYEAHYIFDIEKKYWLLIRNFVILVTLVDSSLKCLERDDGLSLSQADRDKGIIEHKRFVEATDMSYIKHKLVVDISGKDLDQVKKEVLAFVKKAQNL